MFFTIAALVFVGGFLLFRVVSKVVFDGFFEKDLGAL